MIRRHFPLDMDAVYRAGIDTCHVLDANTRLGYHIRHRVTSPFPKFSDNVFTSVLTLSGLPRFNLVPARHRCQRFLDRGALAILEEVANTSVAASCQNRQPAGTRPVQFLTPAGTLSAKQIAIGGKASLMEAVNV